MKLRRLSVNQFKRFTVPTRLGELCDGLNLVVGPNELGKSTLLDALRAVLFERYSSRARPIIALQNDRSGAAPVVELVFEVNGAEYTRYTGSEYLCRDEKLWSRQSDTSVILLRLSINAGTLLPRIHDILFLRSPS